MSRRFGRNQRRALRAELAAAHMATIVEATRRLVGCAPAPLGTPEVERWGIVTWSLSIDDNGGRLERRARVMVEASDAVAHAVGRASRVSFQGGLYLVAGLDYADRPRRLGAPDLVELSLVGAER